MKHAPEILDIIWKQRYDAYRKLYNPKLRIWLSRNDFHILVSETFLINRNEDIRAVMFHSKPTSLFGEEALVAPDISDGEPKVEIVKKHI